MADMKKKLAEVGETIEKMSKDYPKEMSAFMDFLKAVDAEGALSVKTKELISIALSVSEKCEWCVAFHVKNALDSGATKAEIMEATLVATVMGGGPSLMYSKLVIDALEQYAK
jgi:AhpD family alkylhydroperoxidase